MPEDDHGHVSMLPSDDPEKEGGSSNTEMKDLNKVSPESEEPTEEILEHKQTISQSTIITFGLAIILHSLVDGLAIGVFDEVSQVIVLAVSVIIHKIPVAFTVGTSFVV